MSYRRPESLAFSFTVSIMLTSAVLSAAPSPSFASPPGAPNPARLIEAVRREGWSTRGADMPDAPGTPPAVAVIQVAQKTPTRPLSEEKLKLLAESYTHGVRLDPPYAKAFNVRLGSVLATLTYDEDDGTANYAMETLPDDSGYLFFRVASDTFRGFRLDNNLNIVIAMKSPSLNPLALVPMDPGETQRLCDKDLSRWSRIADEVNTEAGRKALAQIRREMSSRGASGNKLVKSH